MRNLGPLVAYLFVRLEKFRTLVLEKLVFDALFHGSLQPKQSQCATRWLI